MTMCSLSRRSVLVGLAALAFSTTCAIAQGGTVKIVYPFAAGGTGDSVARLLAEHLQANLGVPVIVENKVGASGRIGALAVKKAPPNGTTLLFAAGGQLTIQPHLYPNLGYDPFTDFVPISQSVKFDLGFAVSDKLPVRSIAELVAWLKAHPGEATYGSPGAGTIPFFAGTEFSRMIGQSLSHVAYRGSAAALPDLLSGRIPFYIAGAAELAEQHKSGGLRILAIAASSRSEIMPDIPTLRESGFNLDASSWYAFYTPAGTPQAIVELLEKEIITTTRVPQVRTRILAMGFEPTGTTSEALAITQRTEFERWGTIVRASGFKAETE
jgi:tripartite-type tricarboxylate transporter receptor subunit TctC